MTAPIITGSGIHDALVAYYQNLAAIRDAYVDQWGLECIASKVIDQGQHRDFYGDLQSANLQFVDSPTKMVITHHEYLRMVDYYNSTTLQTHNRLDFRDQEYNGRIKYSVEVRKGDMIKIPYTVPDTVTDSPIYIKFRVVDIKEYIHYVPIAKQLILRPWL